jgi:hypothetical protein
VPPWPPARSTWMRWWPSWPPGGIISCRAWRQPASTASVTAALVWREAAYGAMAGAVRQSAIMSGLGRWPPRWMHARSRCEDAGAGAVARPVNPPALRRLLEKP